jgi:hypothetical protein
MNPNNVQLLADAIEELIDAKINDINSPHPSDTLRVIDAKATLQMVLALVFSTDVPTVQNNVEKPSDPRD